MTAPAWPNLIWKKKKRSNLPPAAQDWLNEFSLLHPQCWAAQEMHIQWESEIMLRILVSNKVERSTKSHRTEGGADCHGNCTSTARKTKWLTCRVKNLAGEILHLMTETGGTYALWIRVMVGGVLCIEDAPWSKSCRLRRIFVWMWVWYILQNRQHFDMLQTILMKEKYWVKFQRERQIILLTWSTIIDMMNLREMGHKK